MNSSAFMRSLVTAVMTELRAGGPRKLPKGKPRKVLAGFRTSDPTAGARGSPPLRDGQVIPLRRAGIELARAADLLGRVLDHLLPLGDPADGAGEREQHREHRGREAHRL